MTGLQIAHDMWFWLGFQGWKLILNEPFAFNLVLLVAVPWEQRHIFEGDVTGHIWGEKSNRCTFERSSCQKVIIRLFTSDMNGSCEIYSSYFSVGLNAVTKTQIVQERSHRNKWITVNMICLFLKNSNLKCHFHIPWCFSNEKFLLLFNGKPDFYLNLKRSWFGALFWNMSEKEPIIVKCFSHIVRIVLSYEKGILFNTKVKQR